MLNEEHQERELAGIARWLKAAAVIGMVLIAASVGVEIYKLFA